MTQELASNIALVLNYEIVRLNETPIYNIGNIFKISRGVHDKYISVLSKIKKLKNSEEIELIDSDMDVILNAYQSTTNILMSAKNKETIKLIRDEITIELETIFIHWQEFEKIKNGY